MKQKFYSLAFILYLFFSFIGQFFILNRFFGEGVGTVLMGMLLFPLGMLGGGPFAFMHGLIAFPSNAVVYAVSIGIKSMIKDFLQGQG